MDSSLEHGTAHLPKEVLTHMLQYVGLGDRLRSCARVSRAWRAAAVAATPAIDVYLFASFYSFTFVAWLHRHGSTVSTLSVKGGYGNEDLEFPFQQLQQLQHLSLKRVKLPVYSTPANNSHSSSSSNSTNAPRALGALTSLTSLQLEDVTLPSGEYLAPLSYLTNLRKLQLVGVEVLRRCIVRGTTVGRTSACGLQVGAALANLTRLTHFTLEQRGAAIGDAAVAQLSCLQQLQQLKLDSTALTAASCAQLPRSITMLEVAHANGWQLSSSSIPRLAQLTGLKELTVRSVSNTCIHPEVLSNLVQLQRLNLNQCKLPGEEEGSAALLHVLSQFTELQHLGLVGTHIHHGPIPAAYAALVPTTLTHLDLRDCTLPAAAVQAMFPAAPGQQLPALRVLHLGRDDGNRAAEEDEDNHIISCDVLGPGDVCSLVSCCPGLQQLSLCDAVQLGVQLTALQQLTALAVLVVGGAVVDDRVATQVLVQLTQLQQLRLRFAHSLTDAGLVSLQGLRQLRCLQVQHCGLEYEEWDDEHNLELDSQASPPDVWQQLQEHCLKSTGCLRVMLKQLEGQLEDTTRALASAASAAKDEVASLKQQLAAAQAQAAGSQAQLAVTQQEAAAGQQRLVQQLASAQQQVAQLQQQLAAAKQQ